MAQIYDRQYFYELILNNLAEGFNDHEIIKRLQIPHRTYYRYKHDLANKIAYYQSKVSEHDIALASEIYSQRILKLFAIALTKAQDSSIKDPEFITSAAQLATNLFIMSKNGLVEASSKRANLARQREQNKMFSEDNNEGLFNTVF
jgi:hypothetical protein